MTIGRFRRRRRIAFAAQAAVALGLPFLRIGGESALRLDVPAGKLHAFGAAFAVDEAFVVLAATLLVTAAFLLATLVLGRVWCGWACPQTVLGELTRWVEPERRARPRRWRRPLGFVAVAVVSVVVAADLVWYFVPPVPFLRGVLAGTLGPVAGGAWAVLSAVLFLDLAFLRTTFCATACPYAKLQGVLFDRDTLVVAYDARRAADCVDCGACVRVCPTGIDIRRGLQMECIACAECVDACEPVMRRLRRPPDLVGYFRGEPGRRARWIRPGVVALGVATAACAALLVGVVATRELLDLSAVRELGFSPRRTPDGAAVGAYSVALENHGRAPVTVALSLAAPGGAVALRPEAVPLAAGERRQVRVLATARGLPPGEATGELSAVARRGSEVVSRRSQPVPLVIPPEPP
jgi:cytochrome c oxidase accessory protein FixG